MLVTLYMYAAAVTTTGDSGVIQGHNHMHEKKTERGFQFNDMNFKHTHTCSGENSQITHNEQEIHPLFGSSKTDVLDLQLNVVVRNW